eukprot:8529606-Ditylum_brightwellii.AAC.1
MKVSKLIVDGEVWALLHSCKKPNSSKGLASKEEIVEMKESKLIVDGEVWTLLHSCKKPNSSKGLVFKEEI